MSSIPYKFKQNSRTKGVNLKINVKGELTITSRRQMSEHEVAKLLQKHQPWIESVMAKRPALDQQQLFDGAEIMLYGDKETIKFVTDGKRKQEVKEVGPYLEVNALAGNHEAVLHTWLLKVARQGILTRVQELAEQFKFDYKNVSVRDQSTRWGSCSREKNLNFNWRLALAPLEILDYVVVHELCHLVHHDHTQKFFDLQKKMLPDWVKWKVKLEKLLA